MAESDTKNVEEKTNADESVKSSASGCDTAPAADQRILEGEINSSMISKDKSVAGLDQDRSTVSQPGSLLILCNSKVISDPEIIKRRLVIDGDGAGDDKKLTKLTETYFLLLSDDNTIALEDRLNSLTCYHTFKSLLKQTTAIRTNVAKTYHAIIANSKASVYWEVIRETIRKEMTELKTLVIALRQKTADMKRNKKECEEREALVKLLGQTKRRQELNDELQKLREECVELLLRQSELDEKIKEKKVCLDHLCDLVKRLDNDEVEVVNNAITEAEDRVLSDVSMDLE